MSARGKTNKQLPPANGRFVRAAALCSECGRKCTVGGQVLMADGYYEYNGQPHCKVCIKKLGVL